MWGFTCFNHLWHGSRRHGSRFSGLSFCLKKAFAHDVCRKLFSGEGYEWSNAHDIKMYLIDHIIESISEEGTDLRKFLKVLKEIKGALGTILDILYY